MYKILIFLAASAFTLSAYAQPKKSRVAQTKAKTQQQATPQVDRASLLFPTAVAVPEEVSWRRDIYRSLDLTKDDNAALYYPVEPQGNDVNLFTLLFRLLNVGKIPAYEYKLNGLEDFSKENRMHFKDMLDRYGIYYEIDGKSINVADADVPSSEVLSYYIKESSYYDDATATYHTRVVALCPVLHRSDDFSMDMRKYPMFWVKIDDIEPYLAQRQVMVSNLNNAARMSMADFFATNKYKGTIYMTNNMQGRSLQQQFPTDSLMKKEQARIEKEMTDFEQHIWATPVDSAELARQDSIAREQSLTKRERRARAAASSSEAASTTTRTSRSARRSSASSAKEEKTSKAKSSSRSSAPRVSVRRQRH